MPNINITVAGKIATNTTPGEVIVCGNSDYTVIFDFDNEWDAQAERTARFVYYKNGLSLYQEAAFTGNSVAVPVLSGIDYVLVGVYAGNLITTTPAKVLCDRSILCGDQLEGLSPEQKAMLQAQIGDLSKLSTTAKTDLVAAINEVRANAAGEITDEQVAQALEAYLAEHPVSAGATAEQAAQIEANRQAIELLQENGTGTPGADGEDGGYYTPAVTQPDDNTLEFTFTPSKSDMPAVAAVRVTLPSGGGAGGDSGDTGDEPGGDEPVTPTTHGVVWDLVNVTSSSSVASVNDGAALSAVLTAAEGYTLGDVTVTMGGEVLTGVWSADTATVTIASVTGDVIISCAGVATVYEETEIDVTFYNVAKFTGSTGVVDWGTGGPAYGPDNNSGTVRQSNYDLIDCTDGSNITMRLAGADDFMSTGVQCRCFLYSDTAGTLAGSANPNGEIYTNDAWGSPNLFADTDYTFKTAGYYVRFVLGRQTGFTSNANWAAWLNTDGNVTVKKVSASSDSGETTTSTEEPSVMMLSFNRAYVDSGVYTEDLAPKWDGMFSIHRGHSSAPNNTLQAIWEAKKRGYNCCELDARYTSDNQIVLCHDATVTGTVAGVETTYTIAETPLATLQTVCIGNTAFPDAMVCSLEEAMRLCRRIGMRPEIDYKVNDEQLYRDCVALSKKYGLQDDTLHCCYGMTYALAVKSAYEKASLRVDGTLLDSDTSLDEYLAKPGNLYAYYAATQCGKTDGSNVGENVDNETRILTHKAKGYKMYVWNVTPYLLPDVMQWEPDILQPQSGKDGSDWYTLIRELNTFNGLVF